MFGSNYPPTGGYGGPPGYQPSGGPPPPPGGGYGGYGPGPSAYNVNQYPQYGPPGYGQQGFGQPNPYQAGAMMGTMMGGMGGGPMGGSMGGAVPGFTVPAVNHCNQQYGGGQGPPPMQPPPSMHYGMAQNNMSNQSLQNAQWRTWQRMGLVTEDDDLKDEMEAKRRRRRRNIDDAEEEDDAEMEEMKRKMEERARKAEEQVKELQRKLEQDDALKNELRAAFIQELMRRQEVNGTFEETSGTIVPFGKYDGEDPVCKWFQEVKGSDISGEDWDALYDAEYLRKAVKGLGTDEAAIIAVVSTRCNSQRNRVMLEYKTAYGRDLLKDLRGDLSGNFEEVVLALFETPARYDAWSVKKAIYGLGTNERTLIEILMTRTNAQIKEMVQEYDQITYKKQRDASSSIEQDIEGDTGGDFKRLLISACQGNRRLISMEKLDEAVEEVLHNGKWTGMFAVNYEKLCNKDKCARMAQELFEAGEDRWGTDEETFNRIFSTQDFYTLRLIWDEYVKISQRDIMNTVERETSGDSKKGLLAVAQSVKCRPMFFAERLYRSMKGLGTNDSTLIRIVVSRSEIDLIQIKACFLQQYKQTLWNFIKDDTSGDYRKVLLAIVGKN